VHLGVPPAGVITCILVATIPFGIASFRISSYALWPFRPDCGSPGGRRGCVGDREHPVVRLAGMWLGIMHAVAGVAYCLTLIGIPLGIASFKMIPIRRSRSAARSSTTTSSGRRSEADRPGAPRT
jgi:uncharacterized membrane protein YccF (DUF307 family)